MELPNKKEENDKSCRIQDIVIGAQIALRIFSLLYIDNPLEIQVSNRVDIMQCNSHLLNSH